MTDHLKKTPSATSYFADNPISTASDDLLQRSKFVERIVREIDMTDVLPEPHCPISAYT